MTGQLFAELNLSKTLSIRHTVAETFCNSVFFFFFDENAAPTKLIPQTHQALSQSGVTWS